MSGNRTPPTGDVSRNLASTMAASALFMTTPTTISTAKSVPTPHDVGLATVKSCSDSASVATIVTPLVGERFAMSDDQRKNLCTQLTTYFRKTGVENEEVLSFMTSPSSWPVPSSIATTEDPLNLITVPVTLLLAQLATYTSLVLHQSYFLAPGVSYKNLHSWVSSLEDSVTSTSSTSQSSTTKVWMIIKSHHSKYPPFTAILLTGINLLKTWIVLSVRTLWHRT